tara:strand:- start:1655 stop:3139 length:1485 start_codon:yes stop_codon:yes gene_type:complete
MDYFNGQGTIVVKDLSHLNNLSQEELNSIATGPQDVFFSHLEDFNRLLTYHNIEPLDVTNKWNWKPGSYDKIKEYLKKTMFLHKKAPNVYKLIERTHTRNSYLGYAKEKARQIEISRDAMKFSGVNRDVDVDKFKAICNDFITKITNQCNQVKSITESKVIMVPYIYIKNHNIDFYLDITLNQLNMSIFNGEKQIHSIPLSDIHIICKSNLKDVLNNNNRNIQWLGKYKSKSYFKFPYISASSVRHYGAVCLDRYLDDVNTVYRKCDYVTMSMYLMTWAQYYNTSHANPYNQPNLLHYGMPEDISNEYKNSFPLRNVQNGCSDNIKYELRKKDVKYLFKDSDLRQKCIDVKCKFIGSCPANVVANNRLDKYTENQYEIEAYTGLIYDSIAHELSNKKNELLDNMFGDWINTQNLSNDDNYHNEFDIHFVNALLFHVTRALVKGQNMLYKLEEAGIINVKEVEVVEEAGVEVDLSNMDTSEMETLMQTWVESQRS